MIEGIIGMFILLILIITFFSSTDQKRELLNEIGLDLSKDTYQKGKEKEFVKHCISAMHIAIINHDAIGFDEADFLKKLRWILLNSYSGPERYDPAYGYDEYEYTGDEKPFYYLGEKPRYIKFVLEVVRRRLDDFNLTYPPPLITPCDYSKKDDLKRYVYALWDKYQTPWPKNWMKDD